MDRKIKSFKVDFDFGIQLSGICRWVGDQLQVEMTAPMDGIITTVCRLPFHRRKDELSVEDEAIEELQATFIDLLVIDRNIDEYRKIARAYQAYKHKETRRNAELKKMLAELETLYANHSINRKEYRFQKKLIEDSLRMTSYKLHEFGRDAYIHNRNLSEIGPNYVCQILRWIDRHPIETRQMIDTYKKNGYYIEFNKEEEERKGI